MMRAINNQKGAALIVTLLVIVIMTVTVTEFLYSTWVEFSLSANFRDNARAISFVDSAVEAARNVIAETNDQELNDIVTLYPEIAVPAGDTLGFLRFEDESGKLDLNRLAWRQGNVDYEKWQDAFRKLLRHLDLDERIADYVRDWIDGSNDDGIDLAEDSYYQSLEFPYPCKNGNLDSLEELKRVRGITPRVFSVLKKYVTVNPANDYTDKININTAPPEVILSLPEVTRQMVNSFLTFREEETQPGKKAFLNKLDIKIIPGFEDIYPQISNLIDVSSKTYSVSATVTFNDVSRTAKAIFTKLGQTGAKLTYFSII